MITCQPHNRATIVSRNPMPPHSAAKKPALVRVLAGFTPPPAAHGRPRWHGWWKFPRLPNICAWSLRPAQNICGLPPLVEVGRGRGAHIRPKLERWHVFRMGHVFQTSPIQNGIALPMHLILYNHSKFTMDSSKLGCRLLRITCVSRVMED